MTRELDGHDRIGIVAVRTASCALLLSVAVALMFLQRPSWMGETFALAGWLLLALFFVAPIAGVLSFYAHGWRRWVGTLSACGAMLLLLVIGATAD